MLFMAAAIDPTNPLAKSALKLDTRSRPRRGSRPREMRRMLPWESGEYVEFSSAHFQVASSDETSAAEVAEQLERFHWVWVQQFWRLWTTPQQIEAALEQGRPLGPLGKRFQVVLLDDADQYAGVIEQVFPGITRTEGLYLFQQRTTFLYRDQNDHRAAWYHELAHQLLKEGLRFSTSEHVGRDSDFWLVEGIAAYMESTMPTPAGATVGGWESERLSFARYRWINEGPPSDLESLVNEGLSEFQAREDLSASYSLAAAIAHALWDTGAENRAQAEALLEAVYRGRPRSTAQSIFRGGRLQELLSEVLRVDDQRIDWLSSDRPIRNLVLSRSDVTAKGLAILPLTDALTWFDAAGLPVQDEFVDRLVEQAPNLEQLNLEQTALSERGTAPLAKLSTLRELDLTGLPLTDAAISPLATLRGLETLYLTGTKITDASISLLLGLPQLATLDIQATGITSSGLASLQRERPSLRLNPLQLVNRAKASSD